MNAVLQSVARVRVFVLGAATAVLLPLLYIVSSTAQLVNQLGVDRALATFIVNLIFTWGPDLVVVWFPWLAPFIGIIKSLLQQGASAVISF